MMSEMNFSMSFISQSVKGEVKPEDELPAWLYYVVCFTYLVVVALSAIFIDDLTLIFGIIAGLAECTTVFILPSILYLVACRQEDRRIAEAKAKQPAKLHHHRTPKAGSTFVRVCVCVYMALGLSYFCISNYFLLKKIF